MGFRVQGHFSFHSKNLRVISTKMKNLGVPKEVFGGAGRNSPKDKACPILFIYLFFYIIIFMLFSIL